MSCVLSDEASAALGRCSALANRSVQTASNARVLQDQHYSLPTSNTGAGSLSGFALFLFYNVCLAKPLLQ
jgi:hypothetical protein